MCSEGQTGVKHLRLPLKHIKHYIVAINESARYINVVYSSLYKILTMQGQCITVNGLLMVV